MGGQRGRGGAFQRHQLLGRLRHGQGGRSDGDESRWPSERTGLWERGWQGLTTVAVGECVCFCCGMSRAQWIGLDRACGPAPDIWRTITQSEDCFLGACQTHRSIAALLDIRWCWDHVGISHHNVLVPCPVGVCKVCTRCAFRLRGKVPYQIPTYLAFF